MVELETVTTQKFPSNNLSNFHFYNDLSQLGLSAGVSIKDILSKMPTMSIGVFYCISKSITELPFDTQCIVTIFKTGTPFRIEVQDIWSGRTYVATYSNGTVGEFVEYALKSDLAASQNNSYIVTLQNTINSNLFSSAQYRSRRTQNGTGAAAYGFENVGVNSGALYLDPSDYKLHFINYDGKKFIINWTAEN